MYHLKHFIKNHWRSIIVEIKCKICAKVVDVAELLWKDLHTFDRSVDFSADFEFVLLEKKLFQVALHLGQSQLEPAVGKLVLDVSPLGRARMGQSIVRAKE